jgi:hypothetical protein
MLTIAELIERLQAFDVNHDYVEVLPFGLTVIKANGRYVEVEMRPTTPPDPPTEPPIIGGGVQA